MQYQLDFWPAKHNEPYEQGPWESLSTEEQTETIARLGRLITKAVRPDFGEQQQEANSVQKSPQQRQHSHQPSHHES
jgi:hypothetical protein